MAPYLITAPATEPVTLAEVKDHLRVLSNDEDGDIAARIDGAIATLDGWGGALNRCIMSQTWAIDVTGPGPHALPFPEATSVTATGVSGALDAEVKRSFSGPMVTVGDAEQDEAIVIQFASAMSAERLPLVKSLIKLMVQRDYDMHVGADHAAVTHSIDALVNVIRWRRV